MGEACALQKAHAASNTMALCRRHGRRTSWEEWHSEHGPKAHVMSHIAHLRGGHLLACLLAGSHPDGAHSSMRVHSHLCACMHGQRRFKASTAVLAGICRMCELKHLHGRPCASVQAARAKWACHMIMNVDERPFPPRRAARGDDLCAGAAAAREALGITVPMMRMATLAACF